MKLSRRAFVHGALLGGLGVTTLGGAAVAGTYRFQVNRHARAVIGLTAPVRVAQLSDLHFGPYIRAASVRAWVDAALRARPDLIVITGDFVDSELEGEVTPLLSELARLRAPLGVFGVWGNHDYGSFGAYARRFRARGGGTWLAHRAAFEARLAEAGVRVLTNAGAQVRGDLFLAGVDDLWWGEPSLEKALRGARGATLLLSHNPDFLPEVPEHVALTLCGHTHGGQVRLPFVGALTTSSKYGDRFARGWVNGPAQGFVSRGLGVSLLPVRLNCAPEVVVLDLQPRPA